MPIIRGKRNDGFTKKQIAFIQCWDGDIVSTAKAAELHPSYAAVLAKRPDIQEAIRNRTLTPDSPEIANKQVRQMWWTKVMLDKKQKMSDRLNASRLLGQSEMDFIEKRIIEGNMTIEEKLREIRKKKEKVDE